MVPYHVQEHSAKTPVIVGQEKFRLVGYQDIRNQVPILDKEFHPFLASIPIK
jgi:hypothetical protein